MVLWSTYSKINGYLSFVNLQDLLLSLRLLFCPFSTGIVFENLADIDLDFPAYVK